MTNSNNSLNDIIYNDDIYNFIKYTKENKINDNDLSKILVDNENINLILAINNCFNIYEYILNINNLHLNLLDVNDPVRAAIEEDNKEIIKTTINYLQYNNNQKTINEIASFIFKNNKDWLDILNFNNFDLLSKFIKSDFPNKDTVLLNILSNIDLENENLISSKNDDISSLIIQYDCHQSLNYLIQKEYHFSKYNDLDFLSEIAIDNKSFNCVSHLLEAGMTLNKEQILTATKYVSKTFDETLLNLLREDPYFTTFANKDGVNNLLLLAIKNNNDKLIDWCLEKNVNLNRVDENNNNALLLAVDYENNSLVKKLINLGVNLNVKDSFGNNPLLLAVRNNNEEIVKILTEKSTAFQLGINDSNHNNVTSIDLAIQNKNYEILSYLFFLAPTINLQQSLINQSYGLEADFNLDDDTLNSDIFQDNPLHALLHLGYNFNITNQNNENILQCYLKKNGSIKDISALLSVGVDISHKDNTELDSVEYCIINGEYEKLNTILKAESYSFELDKLSFLLNKSTDSLNILKVLTNDTDIFNSNVKTLLIQKILETDLSLEDFISLSKIDIHTKNLILSQSIIDEKLLTFNEIFNELNSGDFNPEIHKLYSNSSHFFKEITSNLYNSVFNNQPTKKLKLK